MPANPEATRCIIRHCWTFDTELNFLFCDPSRCADKRAKGAGAEAHIQISNQGSRHEGF